MLSPYDLSLRQLSAAERAAWGDGVATELTDRFPAGTVLWFHAGALYRAAIAPVVVHQVRACWLPGLHHPSREAMTRYGTGSLKPTVIGCPQVP